MKCFCGHSFEWGHYKRIPGNGQIYDWVCPECLTIRTRNPLVEIDPWHAPRAEQE